MTTPITEQEKRRRFRLPPWAATTLIAATAVLAIATLVLAAAGVAALVLIANALEPLAAVIVAAVFAGALARAVWGWRTVAERTVTTCGAYARRVRELT